MVKKQTDHIQVKFDLIRAMLPHVPFDGWSFEALEQGAIDIGFEQKENIDTRKDIFRDLFKNGSIDFIDTFSEPVIYNDCPFEPIYIRKDKGDEYSYSYANGNRNIPLYKAIENKGGIGG